jgi:hypothetical protein
LDRSGEVSLSFGEIVEQALPSHRNPALIMDFAAAL